MKNNDDLTETENMSDDSSELLPECLDIDDKCNTCPTSDEVLSFRYLSLPDHLYQANPKDEKTSPRTKSQKKAPKKKRKIKEENVLNAEDEDMGDESENLYSEEKMLAAANAVNKLCDRLQRGNPAALQEKVRPAKVTPAIIKAEDPTSSRPRKRRKSFRTKVGKSRYMYVRPTISKKNPWAAFWPNDSKTTYMGSFKTEEGAAKAINQRCDDLGIAHKAIFRLSRSRSSR